MSTNGYNSTETDVDGSLKTVTAGPDMSWFAVYVKSRHEFQVHERLTNLDIETFLPVVERLRRWKDRKKMVTFPLFPGYLFVHIPKNYDEILTVLKARGVVKFLSKAPGEPAPVPDDQIESLQKLVNSKEPIDPYPYLQEGKRVRITGGPLAGVEGILKERRGKHLLVLSVDVLKQGASVRIEAFDTEPA